MKEAVSNMQSRGRERILRPLLIGSVLLIVNCYWIIVAEAMWFTIHITVISLFFNTIFTLFLVLIFNQFLSKFLPKSRLSNGELLMIYVMVTMGSAMAWHGLMQLLIPIMGHAFWYATPENEWAETFHRYLPTWLTVQDKDILRDHYMGYSTFYTVKHLKAWLIPVLSWTGFIFVFCSLMVCINVVVRKQWVEQEKLAYPMIQLPYEMIGQTSSFFRSKAMWIGFGIAAALDIINGMHQLWPAVPGIHLKLNNIGRYFTTKPWNAMGWLPISFYPFVIGMAFFIPLDLSFSLWFFYLFWKAQRVLLYVLGFSSSGWVILRIQGHNRAVFRRLSGGFLRGYVEQQETPRAGYQKDFWQ